MALHRLDDRAVQDLDRYAEGATTRTALGKTNWPCGRIRPRYGRPQGSPSDFPLVADNAAEFALEFQGTDAKMDEWAKYTLA